MNAPGRGAVPRPFFKPAFKIMSRLGYRLLASAALAAALVAPAAAQDAAPAPKSFAPGDAAPSELASRDLLLAATRAGDRIVAVGEFGHVIYSDDKGATWTQARTVPTQSTLTAVFFADAKTGWAAGHDRTIIATTDGGETWTLQYENAIAEARGDRMPLRYCPEPAPPPALDPNAPVDEFAEPPTTEGDCTFPDFEADSMGDAGSFVGGLFAWAGPFVPAPPAKDTPFLGLAFTSTTHGFAFGGFSTTLETNDGGKTWTTRRLVQVASDDYHLNGAVVGADGSIFVPAERGQIYRSIDGGKSWDIIGGLLELDANGQPIPDPEGLTGTEMKTYQGSFWGGFALRDGRVAMVGMRGAIWITADKGQTWTQMGKGVSPEPLNSGVELSDGRLVAVGNGGVTLLSNDGGKTWSTDLSRADRKAIAAAAEGGAGLLMFGEFGVDSRRLDGKPEG